MSGPVEEFLDGDGNPGADRTRPGQTDADCARAVALAARAQSSRVPPQWFVGVALHETTYTTNERDTEASGKQTAGIFQLTLGGTPTDTIGDATRAGFPDKSPYDLGDACAILAVLAERWLDKLEAAAGGIDDATFFVRGGAGYLAWAHNAGLGEPVTSIGKYGLDWQAARARNAGTDYFDNHIGPYGDDCISGGPDWSDDFLADAAADAPAVDARTSSRLRIGLVLLLCVLLVALQFPKLVRFEVT